MKKRTLILLVLMTLPLMLGGSMPVLAGSSRAIVGHVAFHAPFAGGMDIFLDLDVREVNPDTHEATGSCSWTIWHEGMGWRQLDAHPTCVVFDEDTQTAVFVSRIVHKTGFGQGKPGEYANFWVRDGDPDQWSSAIYQADPFYEFWPRGKPLACEHFDPADLGRPIFDVELGALAIRW
jgi:hypothetical protein